MGQVIGRFCGFFCPRSELKQDVLIYNGPNSAVYTLTPKKKVYKVVYNHNMFIREKKFINQMKNHVKEENIIRYYKVIPDYDIIILEHAEMDLLQWADDNHQNLYYIYYLKMLMGQMASGYRFLYANHIEHYDIKPDNLLLVGGVLKISDFGTCQINMDRYVLNTGTCGFIAPEITGSNKEYYIAHSMDVYSICLMMAYLQFAPIFKLFYRKDWTMNHYLSLEQYMKTRHPFTFLSKGLVVDQRHRLLIEDLLEYISEDALQAQTMLK